jgi:hypothetical protein
MSVLLIAILSALYAGLVMVVTVMIIGLVLHAIFKR